MKTLLKKRKALLSIQAVYTGSSHKPKTQATTKTPSTQPTHQAHHPETHETTKPKFQPVLEIFGKLWSVMEYSGMFQPDFVFSSKVQPMLVFFSVFQPNYQL
jgi:hypothetical protein